MNCVFQQVSAGSCPGLSLDSVGQNIPSKKPGQPPDSKSRYVRSRCTSKIKKRTDNPQLCKLIATGFSAPESCVNPRTAERFRETPPARRLRQHRHKRRRPTLLFSSFSPSSSRVFSGAATDVFSLSAVR